VSRERRAEEVDRAPEPAVPLPLAPAASGMHAHVLALQRTAGNAVVARYVPNLEHIPAGGPNLPTGPPEGLVEGIVACLGTQTDEVIDRNHHWIEIGDESYGWWPSEPVVSDADAAAVVFAAGSPGVLNGTTLPRTRGTATRDPHHGDAANRYEVMDLDGTYAAMTPEAAMRAAADAIRRFARTYEDDYSWNPIGTDCHEFVDFALAAAHLRRGRRQVALPAPVRSASGTPG
jgi:hypothetical protein